MLVLDASAMLAYLRSEPGGDMVRDFLEDADVPIYSHTLNLCEVFYDFVRADDVVVARETIRMLMADGVLERTDFDVTFWEDAATLKAEHRMSLADAFGLALARRLNADFVTADHHELDPIAVTGICQVTFIR